MAERKFTDANHQRRVLEKERLSAEMFSPVRGDNFVSFLRQLLSEKARLPPEKVEQYLVHLDIFEQAFTHSSFNPEKNYEALEFLGDQVLNFSIVYYLTRRLPGLMADDGSNVRHISRLKINLVSKRVFASYAAELGFEKYIASSMLVRKEKMEDLLEDTLEAFSGALLRITAMLDPASEKVGYVPTLGPGYRLISSFLESKRISLDYEDLYDAKTRLKELLDANQLPGYQLTSSQRTGVDGRIVFKTKLEMTIDSVRGLWGAGKGFKKIDAETNSFEDAIKNLQAAGYKYKKQLSVMKVSVEETGYE
jgi:dsRNA-specific ribonuclease